MNEITILFPLGYYFAVDLARDTPQGRQEQQLFIERNSLADFIEEHSPAIVYEDGEELEFCFTPNCWELVRKSNPCPLCEGCLEEYQQEQIDYQETRNACTYTGVIG